MKSNFSKVPKKSTLEQSIAVLDKLDKKYFSFAKDLLRMEQDKVYKKEQRELAEADFS